MWYWQQDYPISQEEVWRGLLWEEVQQNHLITHGYQPKSFRIQVFAERKTHAENWQKKYGGDVLKLPPPEKWQKQPKPAKPIRIRDRFVLSQELPESAAFKKLQKEFPQRGILSIPPELAFGTGSHPTTATCLRLLVDETRRRSKKDSFKDWKFLDLGCGSAILSIAAEKLGASYSLAIDNDSMALDYAAENLKRNGCQNIDLLEADLLTWQSNKAYPIIVANIYHSTLTELFEKIGGCLEAEGLVIFSGILASKAEQTIAAARKAGLALEKKVVLGRWCSFSARKN